MDFFRAMAVLVEYPFLALAPAVLFFALFWISKVRLTSITATLWLAYLVYEYAIKARLLCSGDCNIRVDLLAMYPVLIAASVASLVAFAISVRKAPEPP